MTNTIRIVYAISIAALFVVIWTFGLSTIVPLRDYPDPPRNEAEAATYYTRALIAKQNETEDRNQRLAVETVIGLGFVISALRMKASASWLRLSLLGGGGFAVIFAAGHRESGKLDPDLTLTLIAAAVGGLLWLTAAILWLSESRRWNTRMLPSATGLGKIVYGTGLGLVKTMSIGFGIRAVAPPPLNPGRAWAPVSERGLENAIRFVDRAGSYNTVVFLVVLALAMLLLVGGLRLGGSYPTLRIGLLAGGLGNLIYAIIKLSYQVPNAGVHLVLPLACLALLFWHGRRWLDDGEAVQPGQPQS
jgi:hypothetical protein